MPQDFWFANIFYANPSPNRIVKSFFVYSVWCL